MHCGLVFILFMGILLVVKAFKNDKCGDNIRISTANYLTSPGYPLAYPPSQRCVWVISAPGPHQRILINFNPHFDLEDRECKYDYVEVRDGVDESGQLVGKYCGKIAPSPVVSSGNQLFIKFVSDYETHGAGFSIRYEIFKTGPECSRNFTSNSGVIKSPGFPEKYPNNLDCTFMIFAPKMSEIILEFESFELEPDPTPPTGVFCRYDRLEIWDGFPGVGPYVGRYCGQNTPGRIISYTGILALTINTDSAIAKEGFSANFTVIERTVPEDFDCSDPLGMESGEITSDQIMASSQYNPSWSPERSRLNYYENAWTPAEDSNKEWIQTLVTIPSHANIKGSRLSSWSGKTCSNAASCLDSTFQRQLHQPPLLLINVSSSSVMLMVDRQTQVDLGFLRFVSAIGTQGAVSQETHKIYFVKSYKVDVSSNGEDWITLKEGSKQKQLVEREKKRERGRDGMPDRRATGCNHRLLIGTGFLHLEANKPPLWVYEGTHGPGLDYLMVSPEYTVPSVKWRLKGAMLDSPLPHSYSVEGGQEVFQGNTNPTDVTKTMLPKPTLTRFLRVRPVTWETGIALRFEVYGCKISEYPCSGMLGMVSGLITDSQITASSHTDRSWVPENARLLTSRTGWTLLPQPQPFTSEWLQVDLGDEKLVKGMIIQGGKHRENKVFMKRFRIGYSNNGSDWRMVLDGSGNKPKLASSLPSPERFPASKVHQALFRAGHLLFFLATYQAHAALPLIFEGNSNYDTPELRTVEALTTRFIRIYPERATPAGMGLRLELLGCEIEGRDTQPGTYTAPTLPPTTVVPSTTPSDDCDDDQASCHSGTGDDYDVTAGTIIPETTTAEVDTIPAFLWFACDFGWANDPSFCSWTSEDTGSRWQIQSSGTPTLNTGPNMDHTGGSGNFIYTLATSPQETEVARLVSPVVSSPDSDLCVSFWYHMFGPHIGTLHIKQRKQTVDGPADILLWTVSGHQGNRWREGRVLVPRTNKPYQVVLESLVERKSWGDIAVDDIKVLDGLSMADCKDPDVPTEPMLPEDRLNEILEDITEYPDFVETNQISGAGNMLKTLDPILITIIAMSALGVFLGAICGVVLYCACSHGGMSDRNLSALENYNFELVDGVKLKKDKLNVQSSYSEA
ncbi:hypothetical protein JOQ06_018234 [Pogonophryne albipinna]|uniref:Neuropilin n=1 Tax=Pogonophryne albipinna TaxID=1090488 RepID=A0AAD6AHJ2_9TELE|nr:hypothetical protein JOQ06_018234 [Pogonophryne albipinna]